MNFINFARFHPTMARFTLSYAVLLFIVSATPTLVADSARHHDSFDGGWRFHLGDANGAEKTNFEDSGWRSLNLPHDWSIEGPYDEKAPTAGPGGYLPTGLGWYRKSFTLPESFHGKSISIQFDGVYEHSTVWINGHDLGTRPYGYSSFVYDLTPFLNFGDSLNVMAVRVDNTQQPNSRWYSGSGIFRHTWLIATDPFSIAPSGISITTPEVSADKTSIRIRTRVHNGRAAVQAFELYTAILDATGHPLNAPSVSEDRNSPSVLAKSVLASGAENEIETTLQIQSPRLWSPSSPQLYRLRSEIRVAGVVVDSVETPFGIRSVEYDVDRGLLVNGEQIKMRGVCIHHDGGAVGSAVPEAVLERRLRLLQEMGCNAIRCSHNPMAPEFYDLCDQLGILVMDEAFDEWTIRKGQIKFGYSDLFNDWYERDLVAFIRRDRNHPCVVMWSAGNEIGEQRAEVGPVVLQKLIAVFHREDPTRPVTAAMDNIFNQNGRAPAAFTDLLDIVGYNYADRWGTRRETQYADDRAKFPARKFIGTEDSSVRDIRGQYDFGPLLGVDVRTRKTHPGVGPEGALYTADPIRASSLWRFVATHDYVIGDFTWTGFDYLGESVWPNKLSTSGALDSCGFKKDSYYFYQSLWTTKPMIHLLPHWNWPGRVGKVVPVVAYSNCAAVELFLNGRSLGAKAREFPAQGAAGAWNDYKLPEIQSTTADFQLVWDVLYEPGELKAVGYDRNGTVIAEANVSTAGPVATLELSVDRSTIRSDTLDVAHVTVRTLDAKGVFVPLADDQVTFELSGPGRMIGLDNGNPASHESYQGTKRKLFNGMALAMIQSTADAGAINLVAHAAGLPDATVTISTRASQ